MSAPTLHQEVIVFDGLIVSKWGREVFEHMREGGLTATNCTVCIWEGIQDMLLNIAEWKRWFEEHGDIIMPCRSVTDIRLAKTLGKVGIVFGCQNSSGIEDRLDLFPIFHELGVRSSS